MGGDAQIFMENFQYLRVERRPEYGTTSVNLNLSTVHVATYVYHKTLEVLNGVQWTRALDKVFKENKDNDSNLSWQYFGSAVGFMRVYPGIKWPINDEDRIDLYDCRLQGWYIQGAAAPKNVIILLDSSGSMTGSRMIIAQSTVNKILDTLTVNDYFNIIQFDEKPRYVDSCFNRTLVAANLDNRLRLKRAIKFMKTSNIANFEKALQEAFTLFSEQNKVNNETCCNKAIMLVTDGAPENYEWIFNKYNWKPNSTSKRNVNVRIFPYLIGREVADNRQLRWMAGANKGFYTHISTLADVEERVQNYVKVLSQPLAKPTSHPHIMWTPVYADFIAPELTEDNMRLVTSVSMPVFNKKDNSEDAYKLLGVVGTDVPIDQIISLIPKYQLGVHGYAFAITKKGYVLFHPEFRPFDNGRPKTNYNSVDLTEVELTSNVSVVKNLETAMKDGHQGSISMNVAVHKDFIRVSKRRYHYYYNNIAGFPFSLALVFPEKYGNLQLKTNFDIGKKDVLRNKSFRLSRWKYCENQEETSMSRLYESIMRAKRATPEKCDRDLVNLLAFDADMLVKLFKVWKGKKREKIKKKGVEIIFVGTSSGLFLYEQFVDELTDFTILHMQDTISSSYYEQAVEVGRARDEMRCRHGINETYTFSVPINTFLQRGNERIEYLDLNTTAITVSVPVLKCASGGDRQNYTVAGVSGYQMSFYKFDELVSETFGCPNGKYCSIYNGDNSNYTVFVIDHNGIIITSSTKTTVGLFLGNTFEPIVMEDLWNRRVYNNFTITDYQAECHPKNSNGPNSAEALINPMKKFLFTIIWIFHELIMFITEWSFANWISKSSRVSGEEDYPNPADYPDYSVEPPMIDDIERKPCEKSVSLFLADFNAVPSDGIAGSYSYSNSCKIQREMDPTAQQTPEYCYINKDFRITYATQQIPNTNLLLLVVKQMNCICEVNKPNELLKLQLSKLTLNETDECKKLKQTGATKGDYSYQCFSSYEEEGSVNAQTTVGHSAVLLSMLPLFSSYWSLYL
ncbi:voltage-dependent calcium channel subunit alpha-2/delta-3-like isoform X2 [Octopus sinensis]|nr:voltage-dependent calcium channel subunit alpha-2/delta-3-like isoform X2 [Octopus sinensis]